MPTEARRKKLLELLAAEKRKKARTLELIDNYRRDNLIEFFNKPKGPPDFGMPANPLQAELLDAWDNPSYRV